MIYKSHLSKSEENKVESKLFLSKLRMNVSKQLIMKIGH